MKLVKETLCNILQLVIVGDCSDGDYVYKTTELPCKSFGSPFLFSTDEEWEDEPEDCTVEELLRSFKEAHPMHKELADIRCELTPSGIYDGESCHSVSIYSAVWFGSGGQRYIVEI